MFQTSINPMIYYLSSRRYWDNYILCFAIVPFEDIDFIEVKKKFSWIVLHILNDAFNCCVKETTRNFETLCFLWDIFHFTLLVYVTYQERIDSIPDYDKFIIAHKMFTNISPSYCGTFRCVLFNQFENLLFDILLQH
jgi:hypothetical protein